MPCIRDFIAELSGMQAASGVNPEEVVALGAALQV
jgi:molecular chaperone DnaK (HSP70)